MKNSSCEVGCLEELQHCLARSLDLVEVFWAGDVFIFIAFFYSEVTLLINDLPWAILSSEKSYLDPACFQFWYPLILAIAGMAFIPLPGRFIASIVGYARVFRRGDFLGEPL